MFGAVQRVIGDNPGVSAINPGVQKELKMDEEQVKTVQEKVPAGFGFGGGGKGKGKGKFELDDAAKERFTKYMEKMQALKDVPEDKLEEKIRETFKEEMKGRTRKSRRS